MKTCTKCGESKLESEFGFTKGGKDGLRSRCKSCTAKQSREWQARNQDRVKETRRKRNSNNREKNNISRRLWHLNNPDKDHASKIRRQFGVDYSTLLQDQQGRCAICGTDSPGGRGRFHVDHCHKTGKVRGLLCHCCNLMLGHSKDNPETLARAIAYLTT